MGNVSENVGSGKRDVFSGYVRPKIRVDLLPNDFCEWQSTPDGSLPPHELERHAKFYVRSISQDSNLAVELSNSRLRKFWKSGGPEDTDTIDRVFVPKNQNNARHSCPKYPDDKGVDVETGHPIGSFSRQDNNTRPNLRIPLKNMDEWPSLPGSAAVDTTLYQNFVEIMPLIETFMEQKGGNRKSFTHHASMVYTPAPSRDGPVKKFFPQVTESTPLNVKKNKQRISKYTDSKDGPVWEEQENVLRRIERESSPGKLLNEKLSEKLNQADLVHLQSELDVLKEKLREKDSVLQSIRASEMNAQSVALNQEVARLQEKVEELQQEVWQRGEFADSLQSQLLGKQKELADLQTSLEKLQNEAFTKTQRSADMEEELNGLRCQVEALRYEIGTSTGECSETHTQEDTCELSVTTYKDLLGPEMRVPHEAHVQRLEQMEATRRMYLAAVIAAREKPGEESFILASNLREKLQHFLMCHPFSYHQDALVTQVIISPF